VVREFTPCRPAQAGRSPRNSLEQSSISHGLDRHIYRRCLEALGLGDRPEAAFFVDDVEENVAAARAVGIHGIVFTSARQLAADVRRLGVAL
jgi:hypothetical protein